MKLKDIARLTEHVVPIEPTFVDGEQVRVIFRDKTYYQYYTDNDRRTYVPIFGGGLSEDLEVRPVTDADYIYIKNYYQAIAKSMDINL